MIEKLIDKIETNSKLKERIGKIPVGKVGIKIFQLVDKLIREGHISSESLTKYKDSITSKGIAVANVLKFITYLPNDMVCASSLARNWYDNNELSKNNSDVLSNLGLSRDEANLMLKAHGYGAYSRRVKNKTKIPNA